MSESPPISKKLSFRPKASRPKTLAQTPARSNSVSVAGCSVGSRAGAGGLIWIALPPSHSAGAATIRRAAAATGGHATLIRASAATRAAVDVFEPQQGALAGVTKRVKESFDPKGLLNPGRMWAGV